MLNYPQIDPIIFEIGPLAIRWYSLAYLFGILLGWYYMQHLNRNYNPTKIDEKKIEAIPVWMIISIVLGGRLGYVFFYNFDYYSSNISQILQVWRGGMSFHGGLLGSILGLYLFSIFNKEKFLKITDIVAAATPIGLLLGRIANFINAELIGRQTDVSWGLKYPNEDFARHPSQLYEAASEGLLTLIILYIIIRAGGLKITGLISGTFLICYGFFRCASEFFRQPDEQLGFLLGTDWLTMGMILSLPVIFVGLVIAIIALEKTKGRAV